MRAELLRKKKRFKVSLPIRMHSPFDNHSSGAHYVYNARGAAERSVTSNVSSTGCYFLLSHELPVGALIDMEIEIPAIQPIPRGLKIYCRAMVVRVDDVSEPGKIGIACAIKEYRLTRPRKSRTSALAA